MKIYNFLPVIPEKLFYWFTLCYCIILAFLLLLPLPPGSILVDSLEDIGHIFLFGTLAVIAVEFLHRRSRLRVCSRYIAAFLGSAFVGLLTEVLQGLTSRTPAPGDALRDIGGTFAALVLYALAGDVAIASLVKKWGAVIKTALGLSAVIVFLFLAYPTVRVITAYGARHAQLPLLWDFNNPLEKIFISAGHAELKLKKAPGCASGQAVLTFLPGGYSGLVINEPYPDWSHYRGLVLFIRQDDLDSVAVTLRINDDWHNQRYDDRFNRRIMLSRGVNEIFIPLQTVKTAPRNRTMRMDNIRTIVLFTQTTQPFTITINRLSLE